METTTPSHSVPGLLEKFNIWLQESVMIKLFSIGFLILILLIPSSWIQDVIHERQSRATQVIQEVANKWSGSQILSGPVLIIPYIIQDVVDRGKDGVEIHERIEKAFFLPDQLNVDGRVNPEVLHRGIFDAVVYESSINVKSEFKKPDFATLNIDPSKVLWQEAYMVFGISDVRGISDSLGFMVGKETLPAEPSNDIGITVRTTPSIPASYDSYTPVDTNGETVTSKGISTKLNWQNEDSFTGSVAINLKLKGSRRLDFVPAGKTTEVKLAGPWKDPSFDGEFVPASREVDEKGFTATWKVLHFNRPFSQQWKNTNQTLSGADFGVKLLIPVDQYQKSMRTSKYGILVILLTFLALLMVEITQKIRIHPFQYILIGAALTIYYTLLLSFSEHVGYNLAYIIASAATILLISLYATTFLPNPKLVLLFSLLLIVFYAFIFIIILQQDFSLLIGSIGLFTIIGMLMYFSRKIRWYGL
jgi:inner membrane protein